MLGYYIPVHVEQSRHRLLRAPRRLVFIQHLYALVGKSGLYK